MSQEPREGAIWGPGIGPTPIEAGKEYATYTDDEWRAFVSRQPLIATAVQNGSRFVVYPYCVSIVVLSFRRSSGVKLVPPRGRAWTGLPYVLITLLLGWWGIPWGPIWSLQCLSASLKGGRDVTGLVVRNAWALRSCPAAQPHRGQG